VNKYKKGLLAAFIVGALALASPLKVWVVGETLTYSDINANFQHIHSLMVGGHGPRLTNADVSGSAAISHSKLASPALVPKLWATVASCSSNPCTISEQSGGISSVGWTSAGVMTVNFSARANATFAAIVTGRGTASVECHSLGQTTTTVGISCTTTNTAAATNSGFSILILDAE
jgi:hypothetical protein